MLAPIELAVLPALPGTVRQTFYAMCAETRANGCLSARPAWRNMRLLHCAVSSRRGMRARRPSGARHGAKRGLTGRQRAARREWTRLGPQPGEGEAEHLERLRPLFSFSRRASPPADSGDWMARARARPPPPPADNCSC